MPEQMVAHYRILEKIGEGGMGIVYRAEDTRLHRTVAVKFLPADLTSDPVSKQRFIQEAQAASALDHPNICTIYEFNETDEGQLYMVMAYYDGDSLSRIIGRGKLNPAEAVDLGIQIAEGLARAHARGIVHRDIKSINIMVTRDHLVKILDFGIAKLAGHAEKVEEALKPTTGTWSYMSPEQVSGSTIDDRTDIWSLGVLLYEMISGELPFQGDYAQAVSYSILNESPKDLELICRNIPADLPRIINKALAKDPRQRYQHILELLDDLKRCRETLGPEKQARLAVAEKLQSAGKYIFAAVALIILFIFLFLQLGKPFRTSAEPNSITVLPFKNLSSGEQSDYFSDGITEDILIQISNIRGLKVISFNSSKLYKGSGKSISEIGQELKVRNVLQGTVRRIMDDLRITVQLIDLDNDEVLWADTFERKVADVFTIQNEVAGRISAALKITAAQQEMKPGQPGVQKADSSYQVNIHAYDYYLKGREYYYRYHDADNDNSILLFKKALALDPRYASAYAGLADAYVQKSLRYGQSPAWLDSAMQQSDKALKLDQNSAEAYKALGLVYYSRSWFQKALAANRTAVDLNPNYDPALGNLGWIYYQLGKFDQAYRWLQQAVQLNSTNPNLNLGLGMVCLALREYKSAGEYLEIAHTLQPLHQPNPLIGLIMIDLLQNKMQAAADEMNRAAIRNHHDASLFLIAGDAALQSGNPALAADYYQQSLDIEPRGWQPFTGIAITTNLGFLFSKTAHYGQADTMFALSTQMDRQNIDQGSEWWGIWYDLAAVQAIKGDSSAALEYLYHAHELGFNLPAWLQIDPLFENIRGQERYRQLISAMTSDIETMRQSVQTGK